MKLGSIRIGSEWNIKGSTGSTERFPATFFFLAMVFPLGVLEAVSTSEHLRDDPMEFSWGASEKWRWFQRYVQMLRLSVSQAQKTHE